MKTGPGGACVSTSVPTDKKADNYEASARLCWAKYEERMGFVEKDWCNWTVISR